MTPKTAPKDFFLHLGVTIALYASAIALMNLFFNVINRALPDALQSYWTSNSIVWPISMLIVLVPLFYTLEWLVARDMTRMPEKKDIWVRRWRIYLTLFLTGATIAGDLIVLINTYLNGEITARFIYKVLVVLIVSAAIFKYYILERMDSSARRKLWQRVISWFGIVLVLAGIIGGFVIVGSPTTQRAMHFDDQRVGDLTSIQWQIANYWQQRGKMPPALSDLNDQISGFTVPVDPDTRAAYEYTLKGGQSFQLCATFVLASDATSSSYPKTPAPMGSDANYNWNHQAGRTCFDRTIDPEQYPVMPRKALVQ